MMHGALEPVRLAAPRQGRSLGFHDSLRSGHWPIRLMHARTPAVLVFASVVLGGCVATQPQIPHDGADRGTRYVALAESRGDSTSASVSEADSNESGPLPVIENRPPFPIDPTAFAVPEGELELESTKPLDESASRDRDTWERIRGGLSLSDPIHPRALREAVWYGRHGEYLHRTVRRARPYLAYIVREVEKRELPIEFSLLPIVESAFQPFAYSPKGAAGLWQFIPATGRRYGLKQNWWYDGRRDVVESTRAALEYLTKLLQDFDGDPLLAVAAYNWGEGNVVRAMSRNRARGKPTDVWSLRLPRETRSHVSRLLAIVAVVADPDRFDVALEPIPDRVHFQEVALDSQIDLAVAADLAGITLDEIYLLNPGFKRWATDPGGPHRLQLPRHHVERFRSGLAQLPGVGHAQWARHEIVYGDTLAAIAKRYRTRVAVLKKFNRLTSDRIHAGRHLMVPVSVNAANGLLAGSAFHAARSGGSALGEAAESIHVVRRGDSLWAIARRYDVSVTQLAGWNGISVDSVLRPGQRLTVYRRNPGAASSDRPATAAKPDSDATPSVLHVVERGDTLSGIAEQHGTTVLRIAEFNQIGESSVLLPGQRLHVASIRSSATLRRPERIRYRVKRGDSLWDISRQFGVSIASLRKWNKLSKGDFLIPGRELDVHLERVPAI